jgi:hypothetical protein
MSTPVGSAIATLPYWFGCTSGQELSADTMAHSDDL